MTTLRPNPTLRPARPQTMRLRAQLPAFFATPPPPPTRAPLPDICGGEPTHDFLVPNARPDLAAPAWGTR